MCVCIQYTAMHGTGFNEFIMLLLTIVWKSNSYVPADWRDALIVDTYTLTICGQEKHECQECSYIATLTIAWQQEVAVANQLYTTGFKARRVDVMFG